MNPGVEAIAHAENLNVVRNLLLDWVGEVLSDTGPEAVARMIKLEVKQAQAAAAPAAAGERRISRLVPFSVLVTPPNGVLVLAQNADWVAALEKEASLAQNLAANTELAAAGHQLFVIGSTFYAGGRVLYQCVVAVNGSPPPLPVPALAP